MANGVGAAERTTDVGSADRVANDDRLGDGQQAEITKAADEIRDGEIVAEATALDTGVEGDTFEPPTETGVTAVGEPPPAKADFDVQSLADPNVTRAELDERLRGLSNPDLTKTIETLDTAALDFGKDVTPQGNEALKAEVDRRFTEAIENVDYTDPELADLSAAVARQGDFGQAGRPDVERQWRGVATGMLDTARTVDPSLTPAYEKLRDANRLVGARLNARVPPEMMTNRELLDAVEDIPGGKLIAEIAALSPGGILLPGLAESHEKQVMNELHARMANGDVPLFNPNVDTSAADGVATMATAIGVASMLTPHGALRKGIRELFENGFDSKVAAKIVRNGGGKPFDVARIHEIGEAIAADDVARAAYAQLQRRGTKVVLDFGPPPEVGRLGDAEKFKNRVTIYMQNHETAAEAVSTLVHESSHIRRMTKNYRNTQLDEYYSIRREFLYNNGRRPTEDERHQIWVDVVLRYPNLPRY